MFEDQTRPGAKNIQQWPPLVLVAVATGTAVFVAVLIDSTREQVGQWIADFDLPVSTMTGLALSPVLPLLLVSIVIVTVAKEFVARFRPIANVWNGIVLCLAIACLAVYVASAFAPLKSLLGSLP